MSLTFRICLSLVAGLVSISGYAKDVDPLPRAKPEAVGMSSELLAQIGKVLDADIENGRIPGAVVAIARKGKLVYFEAFGYRDKAARVRMTRDTIFNIASMTKPMVAVGALTLYEQGRITLEDPLAKYFPKFADMRIAVMDEGSEKVVETVPAARPITIRHLLTHTSGIIYGGRGSTAVHKLYPAGSVAASMKMSSSEFLDKLSSLPLLYQPGTVWDYGFGIDLVGLLVESTTNQTLGEYLRQHLFQPLGMVDTGFVLRQDQVARYAKALPNDPDTGRAQAVDPDLVQGAKFECGGGCAGSTASDYLRFAQMLLNKGTLGHTRILGRKTVEYMTSNQLAPDVKNLIGNADPTRANYGFGLGLAVRTTPGIVPLMGSVGDFSWPGASGTNWWVDPHEQLAVVFMAHSPGPIRWHYRYLINALIEQAIVN